MLDDKSLRWSRRLSIVPRWVILPTIQKQNVAEHTFHVVRTAIWLLQFHRTTTEDYGKVEQLWKEAVNYALIHDEEEAATGDRPSTSKQNKTYHAGMPQFAIVVKVADILEAIAFLHEEKLMGNTRLLEVMQERRQALREVWGFFAVQPDIKMGPTELTERYFEALFKSHPGME